MGTAAGRLKSVPRKNGVKPCPADVPILSPSDSDAQRSDDSVELAKEMGRAFGESVEAYREYFGLTPDEARARARGSDEASREHLDAAPLDELSWADLDSLDRLSPGDGQKKWSAIKEAAQQELQNGHRAARSLGGLTSTCWGRAQFLALKDELLESLQPQSTLEIRLVNQLAQYQTLLFEAHNDVVRWSELQGIDLPRRNGETQLPRLSPSQALDAALKRLELFQRLYFQCLRVLQGCSRTGSKVVIRRAEQVNLAL